MPGLSKSQVQRGLRCEKGLWLSANRPEDALPLTDTQKWLLHQASEVRLLARALFPGGVEIPEDLPLEQALTATAEAMSAGARVLYRPAFAFGGAHVRADMVVAAGDGAWDLYEVKSGAALKDAYVADAALQAYVAEGAGVALRSVRVAWLNGAYVYGGGEYELSSLYAIEDVTRLVRDQLPLVADTIERFGALLIGPEPEVVMAGQCKHQWTCEFLAYCHAFLPCEFPVTHLPRVSEKLLHELLSAGHTCIADVPLDFPGLTQAQRQSVIAVQAGEPQVDAPALAKALTALRWPVYHLDFETVSPALPLWPGTRPYQTVPFQYSLHVHYPDGRTKHRHYLHTADGDPRRAVARHLIADCARRGSVVHYSPYERVQIEALMAALPDMAPSLGFIRKRLFDLEPVIRKNTSHPSAAGRSSIKCVLPAWCPDLSYAGLNISDGQTASIRYLKARKGMLTQPEADSVYDDLREYCALDTYATVRLLEEIQRLAEGTSTGEAV